MTLGAPVLAADSDGDGLLDSDEVGVYGTDALNPDTDADGLDDGDEVNVYGTSPSDANTDADCQDDGEEVASGTDPLDPNSNNCGCVGVTLVTVLVDPIAEGWDLEGYDSRDLDTHRVYATFDRPVSVIGVGDEYGDGIEFKVTLSGGAFFNDSTGSDLPPNAIVGNPSRMWDTFVTIGETAGPGDGTAANTKASPDLSLEANGLAESFSLDGEGWYAQNFPATADAIYDVASNTYRVLIAQFTVDRNRRVKGTNWRISVNDGDTICDIFADFDTNEHRTPRGNRPRGPQQS